MVNTELGDIIVALEEWVNTHPEPDKPLVLTGQGKGYSPRKILEEIIADTEFGRLQKKTLIKIAADLIGGKYKP